jgi:AcrR family transcriptional regulator
MGVAERRAREKEALRSRILEAASQLFVQEGFESVSIRRIADRIEYSPATIYLYFKDKAELIGAICEQAFEEMLEVIISASAGADPLQGLRLGLRAYIEFGVAHPHHYLVALGVIHSEEEKEQAFDPAMGMPGLEAFSFLRRAVARCMESGVIAKGDVETTSQALWMCVHGVTSLLITRYGEHDHYFPWLDKKHLIDSSLDLLLSGLQHCALPPAK